MRLALKLATGCAILIAAPASAQILGGGGSLGGSLGGAGQLGGTLGNMNQVTRGSLDGAAGANTDRRSGRANGRARGNGAVDGVTGSRLRPLNRSANVGGGASANTDVGNVAASANANGSAGGSLQGSTGNLAAAGSASAGSGTAIPVSPGMIVRDTSGRVIGRVQSLRARANGMVENVIVRVGDRLASLPDENFSASGNVLVSAMSQAQVSRAASGQGAAPSRGQSQAGARPGSGGTQRGRDPQQVDKH